MPIYKRINGINRVTRQQLEELLKTRDVEEIKFFKNYIFSRNFLEKEYNIIEHTWSHGDKLYKLAHKYYGDRNLFWLIGLYNNKPTDTHYQYGDTVLIPADFLNFFNDVVK